MLILILLTTLLSVEPGHGTLLRKYGMAKNCGRTVYMRDDGIYAIDVVMNITSQMGTLGSCRLTLNKRSDSEQLHFYVAYSSLAVCGNMELYISNGDTNRKTVPVWAAPSVCEWKKASTVSAKHLSTSRRYLVLEFSWKLPTPFSGTVFRLVANTYTCSESCASGLHRCNQGHCINSYLYNQRSYDFCGSSPICSGKKTPAPIEETQDQDNSTNATTSIIIILVVAVVIGSALCIGCSGVFRACFKSCFETCSYYGCSGVYYCCSCCEATLECLANTHKCLADWCVERRNADNRHHDDHNNVAGSAIPSAPFLTATTLPQTAQSSYAITTEYPADAPMDPHTDPPSYDIAREYHPVDVSTGPPTDPPSYDIATRNLPTVTPDDPSIDPPSYEIATVNTHNEPHVDPPRYGVATVNLQPDTPSDPSIDPPSYDVATDNLPTDISSSQSIDPPSYDVATVYVPINTPNDPSIDLPSYGVTTVNVTTYTLSDPSMDPPSYDAATGNLPINDRNEPNVDSPSYDVLTVDLPVDTVTFPSIDPPSFDFHTNSGHYLI